MFDNVFAEALKVTALVFVMMVAVDVLNVITGGRMKTVIGAGRRRQYVLVPLLAATPGCLGMFTNVSLYVHGLISFGALTGGMIAGTGDEAFVMLSMFPRQAVGLILLLYLFGVVFAWLVDRLVPVLPVRPSEDCTEQKVHLAQEGVKHYLIDHVWSHIVKRHLLRTFLWTLGALLAVEAGSRYGFLGGFLSGHALVLLPVAAVAGLIPESGPHLLFVTLFARRVIPFSVLFTSSFVQDGHGTLPLISHSLRDFLWVKAFNFGFGLLAGLALFLMGL